MENARTRDGVHVASSTEANKYSQVCCENFVGGLVCFAAQWDLPRGWGRTGAGLGKGAGK